jgi:hypothetical protein
MKEHAATSCRQMLVAQSSTTVPKLTRNGQIHESTHTHSPSAGPTTLALGLNKPPGPNSIHCNSDTPQCNTIFGTLSRHLRLRVRV